MLEALNRPEAGQGRSKRRGINIEDKELNAALANFKKRNNIPDEETFNKALGKAGLTLKELKQNIADQMIQERLVAVRWGPSP